jgi:hypothetical protein
LLLPLTDVSRCCLLCRAAWWRLLLEGSATAHISNSRITQASTCQKTVPSGALLLVTVDNSNTSVQCMQCMSQQSASRITLLLMQMHCLAWQPSTQFAPLVFHSCPLHALYSLQNKAARGYGGGVYLSESNSMNITNTTLQGNFALFSGGAAFVRHSANLSIAASTVADNLAIIYGAGKQHRMLQLRSCVQHG